MGMFDSMYDRYGHEWQTKAYDCLMNQYQIGDKVPGFPATYQVEVLGGPQTGKRRHLEITEAVATIVDGVLTKVPAKRDEALPLMDYHGHVTMPDKGD